MDRSQCNAKIGTDVGLTKLDLAPFLAASEIIDWQHPDVAALANNLKSECSDPLQVARQCYEWVRDNIQHSADFCRTEVTCTASQVLQAHTGFCYAKSHLLAALLRANRIPAGLCYQRLCADDSGSSFCLHGLTAVFLDKFGWYRIDARGDKKGISTDFSPPVERLAFTVSLPGEMNFPEIWPEPMPRVLDALRSAQDAAMLQRNLPDLPLFET